MARASTNCWTRTVADVASGKIVVVTTHVSTSSDYHPRRSITRCRRLELIESMDSSSFPNLPNNRWVAIRLLDGDTRRYRGGTVLRDLGELEKATSITHGMSVECRSSATVGERRRRSSAGSAASKLCAGSLSASTSIEALTETVFVRGRAGHRRPSSWSITWLRPGEVPASAVRSIGLRDQPCVSAFPIMLGNAGARLLAHRRRRQRPVGRCSPPCCIDHVTSAGSRAAVRVDRYSVVDRRLSDAGRDLPGHGVGHLA